MKKIMTIYGVILLLGTMLVTSTASAGSISDFDLSQFDFDITSITGSNPNTIATGTSNGIGWSISPTSYWTPRTVTNGTFSFSALPVQTDSLHASANYTITFDQKISSLLVALSNDNQTDSINFGLTPSDFSGMSFVGTQAVLTTAKGGIALFENINSFIITNVNTNNILDGYDLAFHAIAAAPSVVPIPAALLMFAPVLLGFLGFRRSKMQV